LKSLLLDGLDGEAVEFDASGKPKPFSSIDERDVEPCFWSRAKNSRAPFQNTQAKCAGN